MQSLLEALQQARARGLTVSNPSTAEELDRALVLLHRQGIRHNLENEPVTIDALQRERRRVHETAQAAIRRAMGIA